jgi:hypothetical protein
MATTVKIPLSPDYGPEVKNGDRIEETAANARQGVTDHNVRYVLALSLSGVIVVYALVYLIFFWN